MYRIGEQLNAWWLNSERREVLKMTTQAIVTADMIGRVIDNFNARVGAVIRQRGAWIEHVINY